MRQVISKSDIHKREYGTVRREFEFNKPEIDKKNYIFNDKINDCRNEKFHSFECRCVFDTKFINMETNEKLFYHLRSDI